MSKLNRVMAQTCLALAAGLFTGGVVASIIFISKEHSLGVLTKIFAPAALFYEFYITLNVLETEEDIKNNKKLFIINFLIVIIYLVLILFF